MEALAQAIKEKAQLLGFNLVGFVPARPGKRLWAYEQWLAQEMNGQMGYLSRPDRVARRRDLQLILPEVQTLICVGLDYFTQVLPAAVAEDPGRGRISNYAWQKDYHEVMTPRLEELARWLQAQVATPITHKVYVDTGAVLERDHAETAGFGFIGKNSMLIHPGRGSWFFLGELLTTLALPVDEPLAQAPTCGRCTRCLTACPTQAFPQPYVLDARRCISYLTIELKGVIPLELRPLMGNWVYGCDICQQVCPFNRFALPTAEANFYPAGVEQCAPSLVELLALTPAQFEERFAHSPIRRLKWERFMRNVCVAAGNWGQAAGVPLLTELLGSSSALVRQHSAWAVGQNQSDTTAVLSHFLGQEKDEAVQNELQLALLAQQKRAC